MGCSLQGKLLDPGGFRRWRSMKTTCLYHRYSLLLEDIEKQTLSPNYILA